MSKLIPVNYDKVIKALTKIGYEFHHQSGSHIVMRLADKNKYASTFRERKPEYMIVVPAHKPIGKGMLHTIMKEAGLSVDEFNELL
ncbi:MAG: type II toxin-antitoxin system HicA family toxin [archaeon]